MQLIDDKKLLSERCEALITDLRNKEKKYTSHVQTLTKRSVRLSKLCLCVVDLYVHVCICVVGASTWEYVTIMCSSQVHYYVFKLGPLLCVQVRFILMCSSQVHYYVFKSSSLLCVQVRFTLMCS